MSYIVFHVRSTVIMKSFANKSSAKRSTTCMNRNSGSNEYAFAPAAEYYNTVIRKKTVKNLMTDQDVEIDSNTPWCCNPASETYWSM